MSEELVSEQQSIMRTIEALHDQVRTFVEKELNCKVTRVSISGDTKYIPPLGSVKLNSTQEDLKDIEYLSLGTNLSFDVEADSLDSPMIHLHVPVHVATDPSHNKNQLVLGRTTAEYGA